VLRCHWRAGIRFGRGCRTHQNVRHNLAPGQPGCWVESGRPGPSAMNRPRTRPCLVVSDRQVEFQLRGFPAAGLVVRINREPPAPAPLSAPWPPRCERGLYQAAPMRLVMQLALDHKAAHPAPRYGPSEPREAGQRYDCGGRGAFIRSPGGLISLEAARPRPPLTMTCKTSACLDAVMARPKANPGRLPDRVRVQAPRKRGRGRQPARKVREATATAAGPRGCGADPDSG